jgi:hypothetical protein
MMTTLQLEIEDSRLNEVLELLQKINIKPKIKKKKNLIEFLMNAPLKEIDLSRDKEIYKDRIKF